MNSEVPEAYRSSTGIEEPVSYNSSALPSQLVLVEKVKLQEISNQLYHLKKHDQLVIEKLANSHSVLFSLNIVWRIFLFLFALLIGSGIFVVLYRIDIINTVVSAGITVVFLGGGLTTFVIMILKLPNDLKALTEKMDSVLQETRSLKEENAELKTLLAKIQTRCDDLHKK